MAPLTRHLRLRRLGGRQAHTGVPTRVTTNGAADKVASEHTARTVKWRKEQRLGSLRLLEERSRRLTWSPTMLRLLLQEMWVEDEFTQIVGPSASLPISRYPQAVAFAIALRHSWRRDDLQRIARRLGLSARGF